MARPDSSDRPQTAIQLTRGANREAGGIADRLNENKKFVLAAAVAHFARLPLDQQEALVIAARTAHTHYLRSLGKTKPARGAS